MANAEIDLLAYKRFPSEHWSKISSTNPIERPNAEIKRRTNVVGVFPNDAAILRFVGAVLMEQHHEWAAHGRRYIAMETTTTIGHLRDTSVSAIPALDSPGNAGKLADAMSATPRDGT